MTTANAYAMPAQLEDRSARIPLQLIPSVQPFAESPVMAVDPVLQAIPAAVILLDQRGVIYQANPAAVQMLGSPLIAEQWFNVISRCFSPRSDDGMEVSLKDGRRVQLQISPIHDGVGITRPGQLIMLTDLTQTRQLQSRLGHMQRLSALGKMMASLAHQIRTPLSAAMLYARNLANPRITLQQHQQFQQKLQSRLQDLEQQLNDMLLFARPDTAQAVEPFSTAQLCSALQQAAEAAVSAAEATLTIKQPDTELWLLGNQSALTGALMNLIHNSLQAVPQHAHITLTLQQTCSKQSHALSKQTESWLQISITDNGPGVPSELVSRLFEPFVTSRAQGTGLGLAVVQAVISSHHGEVSYRHNDNAGACFDIRLPLMAKPLNASEEAV